MVPPLLWGSSYFARDMPRSDGDIRRGERKWEKMRFSLYFLVVSDIKNGGSFVADLGNSRPLPKTSYRRLTFLRDALYLN
jgi:hypothetical protein